MTTNIIGLARLSRINYSINIISNMELSIGTPALLFSTVSLLMIAFTNRFMSMASLIRGLHEKFQQNPDDSILKQIENLRLRMKLIQNMQIIAIISLIVSVICMFFIFFEMQMVARWFAPCVWLARWSLSL